MNNGKIIPKNTRELFIFMQGEFKILKQKIDNIKKITFWVAGISASIVSGIITGIVNLIRWIK